MAKYNNTKIRVGGRLFDSKGESRRKAIAADKRERAMRILEGE